MIQNFSNLISEWFLYPFSSQLNRNGKQKTQLIQNSISFPTKNKVQIHPLLSKIFSTFSKILKKFPENQIQNVTSFVEIPRNKQPRFFLNLCLYVWHFLFLHISFHEFHLKSQKIIQKEVKKQRQRNTAENLERFAFKFQYFYICLLWNTFIV